MLFALLFDQDDRLVAAALAADHQAIGDVFWRDSYPQPMEMGPGWQTAYVQVHDEPLITKLMSIAVDDIWLEECRTSVDRLIFEAAGPSRSATPKAA